MSIVMAPSGPLAARMALGKPEVAFVPTVLPANRLRLRMYSLCLTCFFALISTSLPRCTFFVPAYERLAAVPMLDRVRGVRIVLPPAARSGTLEPPPAAERENDDAEGVAEDATRCASSLAMTREREIRGFRPCGCCCCRCPVAGLADARSGLSWRIPDAARTAAAAASEVGRTGGGTVISGVLNILPPAAELGLLLLPRGLFVIASRAELSGGVLARCAMMLLVLDLVTTGLRVFARELAVGANNLDVAMVLLGLNMLAVTLLLPSAALSSGTLVAVLVAPRPLLVGFGVAR